MGEVDKVEVTVNVDDLQGVIDAFKECQEKRKDLEAQAKKWKEAEDSFREVISQFLKTHADKPANVYIGKIDGKPKVRYLIIDQERFQKDKFGEAHPDLLDQYTMIVPGSSSRLTVK